MAENASMAMGESDQTTMGESDQITMGGPTKKAPPNGRAFIVLVQPERSDQQQAI